MMNIKPIRSEEDYLDALAEISRLMDNNPKAGSDDYDKIDVLSALVENYERKSFPIGKTTAVETIKFHLDRLGWTQTELAKRANIQASHLSAIMNGHRNLSLNHIKKLVALWGIPADQLIDLPS